MRRGLLLRNTPPEWNVKVLTEDDFYYYCDLARITVRDMPLDSLPGMYVICDGRPCIFLDEDLRGAERLFIAFHELAHHWLHPGGASCFHGYEDITEEEADAFAICAMIPVTMLPHYHHSEIAELYGYTPEQVRFRREVFDKYKL